MKATTLARPIVTLSFVLAAAGCNQPAWDEEDEEAVDELGEPGVETVTRAATVGTALLVVSSTLSPKPGDAILKKRLEAAGLGVVLKNSNVLTTDANNKRLVVISSTVDDVRVNKKFKDVLVPVITYETKIFDDMGLTTGTNLGTKTGQSTLVISSSTDVMSPGLSGTQIVTDSATTFSWGKPGSNAVKVATQAGDSSRAVIFRYEKGKGMASGTAKERRVGFFLGDDAPTLLNDTGFLLTDAAIRWAARLPTTRSPGVPCETSSQCASGFCPPAGGLCCDSACTGTCMNCRSDRGKCTPTEAGGNPRGACPMDDQGSCGKDGTCNGAGGCQLWSAGTICADSQCVGTIHFKRKTCNGAGFCGSTGIVDCAHSRCTSSGCLDPCRTNDDCVTGAVCDTGLCVKRAGAPCFRDQECTTGFCADGVCCDNACDGSCSSCNLPFAEGRCMPSPEGTICEPARCAGNAIIHPSRCNSVGSCKTGGARDCGSQVCDATIDNCR